MSERQLIENEPMLKLIKKNQRSIRLYGLPGVKDIQDSKGSPFDSLIKVSIVKYHTRTLSAQLQGYDLQIGLRGSFQNFATSECTSSKGDLLNKRVFADSLPNGVAFIEKGPVISKKLIRVLMKGILIP